MCPLTFIEPRPPLDFEPSSVMSSVFDSYSPCPPQYKAIVIPKKKNLDLEKEVAERIPHPIKPTSVRSKYVPSENTKCHRTVFVGNIPATCMKKHIKQLFKPHGTVESIRLRSMKVVPGDGSRQTKKHIRTGKLVEGSTFNAYVVFSSQAEAEASLCVNGTLFHGRHLRVDVLTGVKEELNTQRSVFVGNVPFSADEEKLRVVFSVCGAIESVRIVRDKKTGVGKGFGFVTFAESSGAMFAVKQHKRAMLDGRPLRVCKSKDQQSIKEEKQMKQSGIHYNSVKPAGRVTSKKGVKSKHNNACEKIRWHKDLRPKQGLPTRGKRLPDGTKNRYRRHHVNAEQ